MFKFLFLSLMFLTACGEKEDTSVETETDTDTDTDSDTDTDTNITKEALEGRYGTATVELDSYLGEEEWFFIGEDDEEFCRISYTLTSTGTRTDCEDAGYFCSWAFDLVISEAALINDNGCADFGVPDVSTLNGTTLSYGFIDDYFGHAATLMVGSPDTLFQPEAFGLWEEPKFLYEWDVAYHEY